MFPTMNAGTRGSGDFSRVLVVDDSLFYRTLISQVVDAISGFRVVGTAPEGEQALTKVRALQPDVVLTDIEMPVMDGLKLIDELQQHHQGVKVLVVSSVSFAGSANTLNALQRGALDFVMKPARTSTEISRRKLANDIEEKLIALSTSVDTATDRDRGIRHPAERSHRVSPEHRARGDANPRVADALRSLRSRAVRAIVIGVSTGGPRALDELLGTLPRTCPPIFIVQHMPGPFLTALADQLNQGSELTVIEAAHGIHGRRGHAYVAPGGTQMGFRSDTNGLTIELRDAAAENHCLPSASYLLREAARVFGRRAMGIIMTGMGQDGADGLLAMRKRGAMTIVQDSASCIVHGMPKEALRLNAADFELSLPDIVRLVGSAGA